MVPSFDPVFMIDLHSFWDVAKEIYPNDPVGGSIIVAPAQPARELEITFSDWLLGTLWINRNSTAITAQNRLAPDLAFAINLEDTLLD